MRHTINALLMKDMMFSIVAMTLLALKCLLMFYFRMNLIIPVVARVTKILFTIILSQKHSLKFRIIDVDLNMSLLLSLQLS